MVEKHLKKILEGDAEAAAWLYDTFSLRLFQRLRQRYGYPGGLDPEDLLQDAFIFYFQNDSRVLRRFLERHAARQLTETLLERYLWDLACGVATNRRRSAARQTVVSLDEHRRLSTEAQAEAQTIDRDTLKQLDTCLRNRGQRVYLYYKFRHRDGLSPDEIAQTTGWSKKAVYKLKQALNKAVAFCAEELGMTA